MFTSQTIVTIDNSFRNLIKAQVYEKYVLTIINSSRKIFEEKKFVYIENQSHGESDFIDNNGQRYDAKLLFDKTQGALIGESKNEISKWFDDMLAEKIEFSHSKVKGNLSFVNETKLYQVVKARLISVKPDEYPIFFLPFPIVDEYKESIYLRFATDFLQAVYYQLEENNLIGNRKVYFIYPSGTPKEYVLREASGNREYIICNELDDFISYSTRILG